jgi:hypothetical protein
MKYIASHCPSSNNNPKTSNPAAITYHKQLSHYLNLNQSTKHQPTTTTQHAYHAQDSPYPHHHPRCSQGFNTHNTLRCTPFPQDTHHGPQARYTRSPRYYHYHHHKDNAHYSRRPRTCDCRACAPSQAQGHHGRQGVRCAHEVEG